MQDNYLHNGTSERTVIGGGVDSWQPTPHTANDEFGYLQNHQPQTTMTSPVPELHGIEISYRPYSGMFHMVDLF